MENARDLQTYLPAHAVLQRYGIAARTLDRWLSKEEMNFPKPLMLNARKRVWAFDELNTWEIERATRSISTAPTRHAGHAKSAGAVA